jgi:hypothetical protein
MVNVQEKEFRAYKSEQETIINDLKRLVEDLKKDNLLLSERVLELENSKSSQPISSESWASKVKKTPDQMEIINIIANETKDRGKRENNLVIFGLKESIEVDKSKAIEEDKKSIDLIMQKLDVNVKIKDVIKLKSNKNGFKAPYVVILNDKSERNLVLKKAKELKKDQIYENVYINPDLTEIERYKSKLLREECKKQNNVNDDKENYYFGIRNDKVVRIQK